MQTLNNSNFGIMIAYLLPGVIALWGISFVSETVRGWFGVSPENAATIGGFLHTTLASLAIGLLVSALRWGIVDAIHHRTGVRKPELDFAALRRDFHVFEGLVENHYRYYQSFSGTLLAAIVVYGTARFASNGLPPFFAWPDVAFVMVAGLLFLGSRDAIKKYYLRTNQLTVVGAQATRSRRENSNVRQK